MFCNSKSRQLLNIYKVVKYMAKINEVTVTAGKVYKRKVFVRLAKIIVLLLLVVVSLTYFILYMINNGAGFTIRVDKELTTSNIFLTLDDSAKSKNLTRSLSSKAVDYMDNISINWIDQDVDTQAVGSHNGNNYYAYTFFLVNKGDETINYWYQISIEDTLLNLDEAIRVMVFHNGEKTVYAKLNSNTKKPESGTKKFYNDGIPVLEEVKNFAPGDKDRFTVVVWIEGDDPDCNNELIGGGIKMSMKMTEERIERDK